jgi:hypothetical protein
MRDHQRGAQQLAIAVATHRHLFEQVGDAFTIARAHLTAPNTFADDTAHF